MPITYDPTIGNAVGLAYSPASAQDAQIYPASTVRFTALKWMALVNENLRLIDIVYRSCALPVVNRTGVTIPAGPVALTGWDAASAQYTVGLATAGIDMFLRTSLLADASDLGYLAAEFTSSLDCSASAVGNPVYCKSDGTLTLTESDVQGANKLEQVAGFVKTVANPGVVDGIHRFPSKWGTSWLQAQAVTKDIINVNVAGNALSGGGGSALAVQVDDLTIGVTANQLVLKSPYNQQYWGNLASDPVSANLGDVYYNTGSNQFKIYNGAWVAI